MHEKYHYRAYGLVIRSELALPELLPSANGVVPDVEVRFGAIDRQPSEADAEGCFLASADEAFFAWKADGRYLVQQGREIIIDAHPGADERFLRLVVTGIGLGVLLHQRGCLTFHASAVRLPYGTAAFIGDKGAGKSTTAAALNASGFPLITDDVLAVVEREGAPGGYDVQPGFPQVKLWPDALESLIGTSPHHRVIQPGLPKKSHRVEHNFDLAPVPLLAMFILEDGPEYSLEQLSARDAVLALTSHSYALRFLGAAGVSGEHFRRSAALARRVPLYVLKRPRALERVQDLTGFITDHLADLGSTSNERRA